MVNNKQQENSGINPENKETSIFRSPEMLTKPFTNKANAASAEETSGTFIESNARLFRSRRVPSYRSVTVAEMGTFLSPVLGAVPILSVNLCGMCQNTYAHERAFCLKTVTVTYFVLLLLLPFTVYLLCF